MPSPVEFNQLALKQSQAYIVQPPQQLAPNNSAVAAYDVTVERSYLGLMVLQNVGTLPLKICLDNDASAALWHFVLAPGTANDDGFGATIDLSTFKCRKVSVFCAGAGRVSMFKAYAVQ